MRNLKWLKDKNGDLIAYAFKGETKISLRVKKDFTYEGWLLQGSSFLTANNNIKIFIGKEQTATKAIIAATAALYKYLGENVVKDKKKEEIVEEVKEAVQEEINTPIEKEVEKPKKKIKIFVHEDENNYELITNEDVDEIRYLRGKRSITSKKIKAKVYDSPIAKEKGVSYSAAAFIGDEVVANIIFGEK